MSELSPAAAREIERWS